MFGKREYSQLGNIFLNTIKDLGLTLEHCGFEAVFMKNEINITDFDFVDYKTNTVIEIKVGAGRDFEFKSSRIGGQNIRICQSAEEYFGKDNYKVFNLAVKNIENNKLKKVGLYETNLQKALQQRADNEAY